MWDAGERVQRPGGPWGARAVDANHRPKKKKGSTGVSAPAPAREKTLIRRAAHPPPPQFESITFSFFVLVQKTTRSEKGWAPRTLNKKKQNLSLPTLSLQKSPPPPAQLAHQRPKHGVHSLVPGARRACPRPGPHQRFWFCRRRRRGRRVGQAVGQPGGGRPQVALLSEGECVGARGEEGERASPIAPIPTSHATHLGRHVRRPGRGHARQKAPRARLRQQGGGERHLGGGKKKKRREKVMKRKKRFFCFFRALPCSPA